MNEKSEWIKVENGLPENREPVWINIVTPSISQGIPDNKEIEVGYWTGYEWYQKGIKYPIGPEDFYVSHWRPYQIPEPPED